MSVVLEATGALTSEVLHFIPSLLFLHQRSLSLVRDQCSPRMSQGLIQLLGKVLQAERSEEFSYEHEAKEKINGAEP